MAKKTTKSDVTAAIAAIKKKAPGAAKKHGSDEVKINAGNLPNGIENGTGKLTGWNIGLQDKGTNKGQPFVTFKGVCMIPEEFKGRPVQKTIFVSAGKAYGKRPGKTIEEKVAQVTNDLQILGAVTKGTTEQDWPGMLDELVENETYFKFRTWAGEATKAFPNPRTQMEFLGVADDFVESDDDEVEEDEDAEDEEDEDDSSDDEADDDAEDGDDEADDEADDEDDSEDDTEDDDEDVVALGETADVKKATATRKAARVRLTELAEEKGIDPEKYDTWAEVAEAIAADEDEAGDEDSDDEEDDEEEEEEDEEDDTPEKGSIWKYKAPGTKKLVEMEVTAVSAKAKTVNLATLDGSKKYAKVKWTELKPT